MIEELGEQSLRFKQNIRGETMFDKLFEGVILLMLFLSGLYFTFAMTYMILARIVSL